MSSVEHNNHTEPGSGSTTEDKQLRRVDFYIFNKSDKNVSKTFEAALRISAATTDPDTSCAAYASAIGMILPGFVKDLKEAMRRHGIEAVDVFLPSEAAVNSTHSRRRDMKMMLVLFGVGVLLLLKHLKDARIKKFVASRLSGLKSALGVSGYIPNPFTLKQAENVRRVFGSDAKLKKLMVVLLIRMSGQKGNIGACGRYLMQILEWSGMGMFKSMHDELFVRGSVVVDDPALETEVVAAREAIDKVMKFTRPAFFRFLASVEDQHLVDSSRFPTLITLTSLIMPDYVGSKLNFSNEKGPEIERLLDIHCRQFPDGSEMHKHRLLMREISISLESYGL